MISFFFVQMVVGRFLEENMGAWFPFFRIDTTTVILALLLAAGLGLLAAAVPAYTTSRLKVVDALRRTG
jgi:putative ABC transport system permease protein